MRGRENAGASYKEPFTTHETCSYIDIKPLRCVMNIEARFYEVMKGARAVSRADKIARSIVIKLDQKPKISYFAMDISCKSKFRNYFTNFINE